MRSWWLFVGVVLFAGLGLSGHVDASTPTTELAAADGVRLPPGFFVQTVVSDLRMPTDLVILPAGDMLITEKGSGLDAAGTAQVRLVRQGVLQTTPVLELSTSVQVDSGLASIVLDPEFAQNGAFYLWYATGQDSLRWSGQAVNRLSRFVFDAATGTADPTSETIILDNVPWSTIHNGGGLRFDRNGNLVISTGDIASPLDPALNVAQNYRSLGGKVLRIRPLAQGGYTIPGDNPYADGQRQVNGVTPLPEIYAAGLRNPFRMFERQADRQLFVVDVGQTTWEEINRVRHGVNYGWPVREGPCPLGKRYGPECTPAPAQYTDPVLAYPLPANGGSIVGVTFYEGDAFPEAYRNRLFFADFNNHKLFTADLSREPATFTQFAENSGFIVDMEATQSGLYWVDIVAGHIQYLYYDGAANQPPVPSLSVAPTLGAAPLTVNFSAEGTYDPDDLSFSYRWTFGDGSEAVTSTIPRVTHTYTTQGNFRATLQAVDVRGGESEILTREITVYNGAMPTIVQETLAEPGRMHYQGGDSIQFKAAREGGLSGLDATTPYRWDIDLHHNEHTHPVVSDYAAPTVTLAIPVPSHDLASSLWYRVHLTMLTDQGIRVRVSHDVMPHLVDIQLASWPAAARVTLNRMTLPAFTPTPVIVGQSYELYAPARVLVDRRLGAFSTWVIADGWPVQPSSGGIELLDQRNAIIIIGPTPKMYVAFYNDEGPAPLVFVPTLYGR